MNERIKELAEQAGSTHKQNLGVYQFYESELEKFAELLLSRAMSICEDLGDQGLDGHYCVDKIRKEFGL